MSDETKAPPAPIERVFYTTADLARELGVTDRAVRLAIQSGELVAHRRMGRWVMDVEDVRRWVATGQPSGRPRAETRQRVAARRRSLADAFGNSR